MHAIFLTFCALAASSIGSTDEQPLFNFFKHVNTAMWPASMKAVPPNRIERDKEGRIVRLRLDGMQLVPGDFEGLRQLSDVQGISFNYTNITDAQIKKLAALPHLKGIQLNHTAIGDEGVKNLAELLELQVLCLGGVKASPEAVKSLKQAKPKLSYGYFWEAE
jgi:hypothetical protein